MRYGAIEATLDRAQGANVWLTLRIREGKNREVKNVLGHLGLAVNRLIRVSFGPFQLGDLRRRRGRGGARRASCASSSARGSLLLAGADFSAAADASASRRSPRCRLVTPSDEQIRVRGNESAPPTRKVRRRPDDRMGEPERARREKRRGRRPARGKPR